ncbi:calcineurin-like phosphoesterase family protein [Stackebrandtia albiflava]|uniref:Calcineurin-like phosphoesterase family protein n=1 Tax=Stackebrandtia albiflava TaxID=406432 RepID=A0A562UQ20_9ACTN|nr:metallophosphoesterase [Stackebrandtia albiflava]TWJ07696.1 calcineurin-like phosphoesterase family protein [Stackebrandtia albiflava]
MASDPALHVVSDVHGHYDALVAALGDAGLVDGSGHWSGGNARLWFLGDLFDRGTDGTAVVDLIMRLADEAEGDGGLVDSLLGNHEVLMLGARRFGDDDFADEDGNSRNFMMWWHLNGGQDDDVARLTDKQINWLQNRKVMTYAADHLLVHTDTVEYAAYGRSITAVNRAVRKIVKSADHEKWWMLFRRLTIRHRYEAEDGAVQAAAMLDCFGGSQIVHGHSTIPDRLGIPGDQVVGPRRYCEALALCVDGGIYQGGPCLVVSLPVDPALLQPDPSPTSPDTAAEPEGETRRSNFEGEGGADTDAVTAAALEVATSDAD